RLPVDRELDLDPDLVLVVVLDGDEDLGLDATRYGVARATGSLTGSPARQRGASRFVVAERLRRAGVVARSAHAERLEGCRARVGGACLRDDRRVAQPRAGARVSDGDDEAVAPRRALE